MIKINKKALNRFPNLCTANLDPRIKLMDWEKFLEAEYVYIGTHNGHFHPDEIHCIALIYLLKYLVAKEHFGKNILYPSLTEFIAHSVIRASTIDDLIELGIEKRPYIIVDVRGGHYDHHQSNQGLVDRAYNFDHIITKHAKRTPSDLLTNDAYKRLCSFGSLWCAVGRVFDIDLSNLNPEQKICHMDTIENNVWSDIFEEIAFPISLVDTNGPDLFECTYSKIISDMNLTEENVYNDLQGKDQPFAKAVEIAYAILAGAIVTAQNKYFSITEAYKKCQFKENKNVVAYLQIPKVDNPDDEVKLGISTLNELVTKRNTHPLFLFNPNPSSRDTCCRIVMSRWAKLDVENIKKIWSKYVFIHPDGFLMTFCNSNEAEEFIKHLEIRDHLEDDKVILGV